MSKKSSTFAPDLGAANEPAQFVSSSEGEILKSQNVISNSIKMGARKLPYAFTENGIAMLSSVLRSPMVKSGSASSNWNNPPMNY